MNYYAIEYPSGSRGEDGYWGVRPNRLVRFDSKRDRDNWVWGGQGSNARRERAATTATRARRIAHGRYWHGYSMWFVDSGGSP